MFWKQKQLKYIMIHNFQGVMVHIWQQNNIIIKECKNKKGYRGGKKVETYLPSNLNTIIICDLCKLVEP